MGVVDVESVLAVTTVEMLSLALHVTTDEGPVRRRQLEAETRPVANEKRLPTLCSRHVFT